MTRTIEDDIDLDNTEDLKCMMVLLMLRICNSIEPDYQENDLQFRQHVIENLLHDDEKEHLPVPVFSYHVVHGEI